MHAWILSHSWIGPTAIVAVALVLGIEFGGKKR